MTDDRTEDHYFSPAPQADSAVREITAVLREMPLRFMTDSGVFSKDRIDRGTRLLVNTMPLPPKGPILDLGCGYGPIGITAAVLRPDLQVYLSDPNQRATSLARHNARLNGAVNVRVVTGAGFEALDSDLRFSAILTNPPYRAGKKVVYSLIAAAADRLLAGGSLLCVGRTKQGVLSLKAHMHDVFGNAEEIAKKSGYRVLRSLA